DVDLFLAVGGVVVHRAFAPRRQLDLIDAECADAKRAPHRLEDALLRLDVPRVDNGMRHLLLLLLADPETLRHSGRGRFGRAQRSNASPRRESSSTANLPSIVASTSNVSPMSGSLPISLRARLGRACSPASADSHT